MASSTATSCSARVDGLPDAAASARRRRARRRGRRRRRAGGRPGRAGGGRARRRWSRFSALTESTSPIGGRATSTSGVPRAASRSTTSSVTVRPRTTRPSQRPAIAADRGLGVVAAVGGQDQHGAAELGGDGLVAEHDLGVVGAGQVGEDDAVGGVPALGELAAELAGGVLQVRGRGHDPVAGVRADVLRVAHDPRDGGDRDAGMVAVTLVPKSEAVLTGDPSWV